MALRPHCCNPIFVTSTLRCGLPRWIAPSNLVARFRHHTLPASVVFYLPFRQLGMVNTHFGSTFPYTLDIGRTHPLGFHPRLPISICLLRDIERIGVLVSISTPTWGWSRVHCLKLFESLSS